MFCSSPTLYEKRKSNEYHGQSNKKFRSSQRTINTDLESRDKIKTKYVCDICNTGNWLSETDVEIHRKEKHKTILSKMLRTKDLYCCTVCMRPNKSKEELLRHIKTKHLLSSPNANIVEHDIFVCHDCDRIFFNKKMLAVHLQYVHTKRDYRERARVDCPLCSKEIRLTTTFMRSHLLFHMIVGMSTCQICLEPCENQTELKTHLDKHPKYFYCYSCNYNTNNAETFDVHTRNHRAATKNTIKVESFRKYFIPNNTSVVRQYEINSIGLKGLLLPPKIKICILCREIVTDPFNMQRHVEEDHAPVVENKKLYGCVCNKVFYNSVLLKHHLFKLAHEGTHRAV